MKATTIIVVIVSLFLAGCFDARASKAKREPASPTQCRALRDHLHSHTVDKIDRESVIPRFLIVEALEEDDDYRRSLNEFELECAQKLTSEEAKCMLRLNHTHYSACQ